jgi:hypothetical protein
MEYFLFLTSPIEHTNAKEDNNQQGSLNYNKYSNPEA